jgi:bifunctional non-homologous end joining protein LigD
VGLGLEGIVAKRADSPYQSGRSDHWLKIRADKTGDFVVVGYTAPKGSRGGFGALHLGGYSDGTLVYVGRAGSGFSAKQLKEVSAELERLAVPKPPFEGAVPAEAESRWVAPELVAEVRYKEITGDGLLRQPVFLRFRDDKTAEECTIEGRGKRDGGRRRWFPLPPFPLPLPQEFDSTNLRGFWPAEGYTRAT